MPIVTPTDSDWHRTQLSALLAATAHPFVRTRRGAGGEEHGLTIDGIAGKEAALGLLIAQRDT